jgi:hypothetical protein
MPPILNIAKIIDRKYRTNSKGTIIGKHCIDEVLLTINCVYFQLGSSQSDSRLNQKVGYEETLQMFRADFQLPPGTLINIEPTMYLQFYDANEILHEYKIVGVTSLPVGCMIWVKLDLQLSTPRDYKVTELAYNNLSV